MMSHGEWAIYASVWQATDSSGTLDPVFATLMRHALSPVTARDARNTVRMKIDPMRFSGDMNTSLGNTLHNYMALSAALSSVGCNPYGFVCEGDDALVCIDRDRVDGF